MHKVENILKEIKENKKKLTNREWVFMGIYFGDPEALWALKCPAELGGECRSPKDCNECKKEWLSEEVK